MKSISLLVFVVTIFETAGQSNEQSIYVRRASLQHLADSLLMSGQGYTPEYVTLLKKTAATDTDTFLIAATSYGRMKDVFLLKEDSTLEKIAAETELYYLNKSLAKYPDNFDAYAYRLKLYKYSTNKDSEEAFIKTFQEKFSARWEMNFVMAYHYIYQDFLWPGSKEFEICSNYLKKAIELNPKEFNSLLLLSVAYENDKQQRMMYLKKMYAIATHQFKKKHQPKQIKGSIHCYIHSEYTIRTGFNRSIIGCRIYIVKS